METSNEIKEKSKLTAGLLGIFLGCFGAHNFYIGNNGKAIAQLLITLLSFGTLFFISAIWGIIEGILILCGSMDINTNNSAKKVSELSKMPIEDKNVNVKSDIKKEQAKIINVKLGIEKEQKKKKYIIYISIIVIIAMLILAVVTGDKNTTKSSSINISSEQKETIIKFWNNASGYGTQNLKRIALNKIATGYELYLEYDNTAHNGNYVVVSKQGTTNYYNDEINPVTGMAYGKNRIDTLFKVFEADKEDIVLTLDEFKEIIK